MRASGSSDALGGAVEAGVVLFDVARPGGGGGGAGGGYDGGDGDGGDDDDGESGPSCSPRKDAGGGGRAYDWRAGRAAAAAGQRGGVLRRVL